MVLGYYSFLVKIKTTYKFEFYVVRWGKTHTVINHKFSIYLKVIISNTFVMQKCCCIFNYLLVTINRC